MYREKALSAITSIKHRPAVDYAMVEPIDEMTALIDYFTTAATADPVSAVLIASGGLLILAAVIVMGWLVLGALASEIRSVVA